jgi:hypothetical protein
VRPTRDRHLLERDGVSTIVRVVDRFTTSAAGPDAPEQPPSFSVEATLVLLFTSGSARGRYDMELRPEHPMGTTTRIVLSTIEFPCGEMNARIAAPMRLQLDTAGLYWIQVLLDGRLFTKVPIRIVYQRLVPGVVGPTPPAASGQ